MYFKPDDLEENLLEPDWLDTMVDDVNALWFDTKFTYNGEELDYRDVCWRYYNGTCANPYCVYRVWGFDEESIPDDIDTVLDDINEDPIISYNYENYQPDGTLWRKRYTDNNITFSSGLSVHMNFT
eukprot:UN04177